MDRGWPKYRELLTNNNHSMHMEVYHTTAISRGMVCLVISMFMFLQSIKKYVYQFYCFYKTIKKEKSRLRNVIVYKSDKIG